MKHKLKKIQDQVIVITGASSGIGLATARMAARRGAKVVLSSRNEEDLREICDGIRKQGGQAEFVVADVANDDDVQRIAWFAIEKFGGFDTWVNNAGVSVYGKLVDTPLADKRRVFDVNFWGMVHGCKAAVPHLKQHGGALINVGSEVSEHAIPLQGIYAASKHAMKAYTNALRMELEKEEVPVSVTLIKPAAIDTPYLEHAQSYMNENPDLPPPVYSPEIVARAILRCAQKPVPSLFVGGSGAMVATLDKIFPRLTQLLTAKMFYDKQKTSEPKPRDVGLFAAPSKEGNVRGQSSYRVRKWSLYTAAALHPLLTVATTAAAIGGLVALRSMRARRELDRLVA